MIIISLLGVLFCGDVSPFFWSSANCEALNTQSFDNDVYLSYQTVLEYLRKSSLSLVYLITPALILCALVL
jgi:hypothetical protein